jgi:hypothetical protein
LTGSNTDYRETCHVQNAESIGRGGVLTSAIVHDDPGKLYYQGFCMTTQPQRVPTYHQTYYFWINLFSGYGSPARVNMPIIINGKPFFVTLLSIIGLSEKG